MAEPTKSVISEEGKDKLATIKANLEPSITSTVKVPTRVSKVVYILQRPDTSSLSIANPVGYDPSSHIRKLGGFLKNKDVGRGLEPEDEARLLPSVLGVQPTSDRWESAVREFWSNLSIKVPIEGYQLEAGMTYKSADDAKAEKNGTPINTMDYIIYCFALKHPDVAASKELVNNSHKIRFYLYSKVEQLKTEKIRINARQQAMQAYLQIVTDREAVKNVILVLGRTFKETPFPDELESVEQDMLLEKFVNNNPTELHNAIKNESLNTIAFIERCIVKGLLKRIANTDIIVYGDSTTIGNTIEEAIVWLANPNHATELNQLKAQLANAK